MLTNNWEFEEKELFNSERFLLQALLLLTIHRIIIEN